MASWWTRAVGGVDATFPLAKLVFVELVVKLNRELDVRVEGGWLRADTADLVEYGVLETFLELVELGGLRKTLRTGAARESEPRS